MSHDVPHSGDSPKRCRATPSPVEPSLPRERDVRAALWESICRWGDGLAIGSTIAALADRGALALLDRRGECTLGDIISEVGGNSGFINVALRLMRLQGWLDVDGAVGTYEARYIINSRGRAAVRCADAYRKATAFLISDDIDLAGAHAAMRDSWGVPTGLLPSIVRHQILQHLDGMILAPLLARLTATGVLPRTVDASVEAPLEVLEILGERGFVAETRVTRVGAIAAAMSRQLWYPAGYLATFARVGELLFGDPSALRAYDSGGGESHVDRALDIRFSGAVFDATCRQAFLDIVLPVLDGDDVPTTIVDTGCGNGTLLRTVAEAWRSRGGPEIVFVGVDPSPVARESTRSALEVLGVQHIVIDGDISEPGTLAAVLASAGVNASEALHVSKSVIHNRRYIPQRSLFRLGVEPTGAYATPDGDVIPSAAVSSNLVEHLAAWRDVARHHGMVVIEAHTVSPAVAVERLGRTIATVLDATHGYSCQYPVEPEVFAAAARAAGLRSVAHRDLGAASVGHTVLTIDRFLSD